MDGGASIEATLELWASSLREVQGRIRPLFARERGAASAGEGTKGARLYDWAFCGLAELDGAGYDQAGVWTRGLLIRHSLSGGERAYFTT